LFLSFLVPGVRLFPALLARHGSFPALLARHGSFPALLARHGSFPALLARHGSFPVSLVPGIACPAWLALVNNFSDKFDDSLNKFDALLA
jgi:hypothetical protein